MTLTLALSFAAPGPAAFALRTLEPAEVPPTATGLSQALSGAPVLAGLEERWTRGPVFPLGIGRGYDDTALIHHFGSGNNIVRATFIDERSTDTKSRFLFRVENAAGEKAPKDVVILRREPLAEILGQAIGKKELDAIWPPKEDRPAFDDPKVQAAFRSEKFRAALAEIKGGLPAAEPAEGGGLVLTFQRGDFVIFFDTHGENRSAWNSFAVMIVNPRSSTQANLEFRAHAAVYVDRLSVFKNRNPQRLYRLTPEGQPIAGGKALRFSVALTELLAAADRVARKPGPLTLKFHNGTPPFVVASLSGPSLTRLNLFEELRRTVEASPRQQVRLYRHAPPAPKNSEVITVVPAGLEEQDEPYIVGQPDYQGPVSIVGKGGGTTIRFQAATAQGLIKGTEVSGPTVLNPGVDTQDQIIDRIVDVVAEIINSSGPNNILYVYLSFPGFYDEAMRIVRDQENIPGLKAGLDLGAEMQQRLAARYPRPAALGDIRVIIEHDGTAGANGERSAFGKYPNAPSLFFLAPGTGIATRAIIDGQPFTGGPEVQFLANEAPHTLVFNNDPANPDYRLVILDTKGDHPDFDSPTLGANGQPNPLYKAEDMEDRTAGPGIARYARQLAASGQYPYDDVAELSFISPGYNFNNITSVQVGQAANWDNPIAVKAVTERARELGIGAAVQLVEFHRIWPGRFPYPPHIVVGGGVAQIGPLYIDALREGFRERIARYKTEEPALDVPDADEFAARIEASTIVSDSARELLAGLPKPEQVAAHEQILAGLEEQTNWWYSDWAFRSSGEEFLQGLHNAGLMPPGFSLKDTALQARLGRILGGYLGFSHWLDPIELKPLFAGSTDGMADLRVIESFIRQVGIFPRKDFFGEGLRGARWQESRGKAGGHDTNQKFPSALWDHAKPLLQQAVEFARSNGGFTLSYVPSVFEKKDSQVAPSTDIWDASITVTVIEPAQMRLSAGGLEETDPPAPEGIKRFVILSNNRPKADLLSQWLVSARSYSEVVTLMLPQDADLVDDYLGGGTWTPQAVVVAGTVSVLSGPSKPAFAGPVARFEEGGFPVRFINEPDDPVIIEMLKELDTAAGLEESGEPLAGLEEIALKVRPVEQIIGQIGIRPGEFDLYGQYIAKIRAEAALARLSDRTPGKLVIITGMTPTETGEGKTTTEIGLHDAMSSLGVPSIAVLREPSLGPVLGKKGPATGTGRSQLYPGRRINLAFTGDFAAINDAHNLLVEALYNAIFQKKLPEEIAAGVAMNYSIDANVRTLRSFTVKIGGKEYKQGFALTAVSEIMAALALAQDHDDLRRRIERIIVAWRPDGTFLTAKEIGVVDQVIGLLEYAWMPNLVQTLEGNPAIVHMGPFANIAHGTNSVIATRLARTLIGENGVVFQETGFGADLGFEKYADVVASQSGIRPDAAVLVVSAKALKLHGGVNKEHVGDENVAAVQAGFPNMDTHVRNIRNFGVPVVVAINAFPTDTDAELAAIQQHLAGQGIRSAVSRAVVQGGAGAIDLANQVRDVLATEPAVFKPLYQPTDPVEQKLGALAAMYGAGNVDITATAQADLAKLRQAGFGDLPLIMVKTPDSLSDDSDKKGAPTGWTLTIKRVQVAAGAGFLRVFVGEKPPLVMPGLGEEVSQLPPLDGEIIQSAGFEETPGFLQASLAKDGPLQPAPSWSPVGGVAGLEQSIPSTLLLEKASLPSATAAVSTVGVVAGTADPKGLAYGVALTRVTTADGTPLPVVFVVESAQQQAGLEQMGISANAIFLTGSSDYPTAAEALTAANRWLAGVYGVGQVVDIGATGPIARTIQQILNAVFGIQITSEAAALWDSFIDRATLALQA